jgi:hypothetical protein
MQMKTSLALLVPLALAACATTPGPDADGVTHAALGQRVYLDGPYVTPLEVLEDSRCPSDVQCIWAGRLRISARIELGSGSETRELTQGEPVQVADGTLELFEVTPYPKSDVPVAAKDYRFGFKFAGGI